MHLCEPAGKGAYLCASLLKRLLLLYRSLTLTCTEVSGAEGMRVIYIGEGESLRYVRETLGAHGGELSVTNVPLWRVAESVRCFGGQGALVCLEINRLLRFLIPAGGGVTYPWIRQRIRLNSGEHDARKRKIEHNYGRKVRKYGYRFRLTGEREAVSRYYTELYLPHMRQRFTDPHMRTLAETHRAVRGGFLLQVLADDLWVAGAVCRAGLDEISVISFGHLPDGLYPLRFGALSAVYYFLVDYARGLSLSSLDLLRSRPHADDGVYRHKRFWGATAEPDPWPHTLLSVYGGAGLPLPEGMEGVLVWEEGQFVGLKEALERRRFSAKNGAPGAGERV